MKGKRIIIALLCVLVVLLSTSACREEVNSRLIPLEREIYASSWSFTGRPFEGAFETQGVFSTRWLIFYLEPASPYFNPNFVEMVFVHNAEDAYSFSEDTLVLWPSEYMQRQVERLNYVIQRPRTSEADHRGLTGEIDLESFGLTYPITIETVVDEWEKIYELWLVLSTEAIVYIRGR